MNVEVTAVQLEIVAIRISKRKSRKSRNTDVNKLYRFIYPRYYRNGESTRRAC